MRSAYTAAITPRVCTSVLFIFIESATSTVRELQLPNYIVGLTRTPAGVRSTVHDNTLLYKTLAALTCTGDSVVHVPKSKREKVLQRNRGLDMHAYT